MAKKSGDEKGSRGAKASGNLTEGKAIRNSVFDGKISKISRVKYNARTGMLTVGSYRRRSPHMKVTKR